MPPKKTCQERVEVRNLGNIPTIGVKSFHIEKLQPGITLFKLS